MTFRMWLQEFELSGVGDVVSLAAKEVEVQVNISKCYGEGRRIPVKDRLAILKVWRRCAIFFRRTVSSIRARRSSEYNKDVQWRWQFRIDSCQMTCCLDNAFCNCQPTTRPTAHKSNIGSTRRRSCARRQAAYALTTPWGTLPQ